MIQLFDDVLFQGLDESLQKCAPCVNVLKEKEEEPSSCQSSASSFGGNPLQRKHRSVFTISLYSPRTAKTGLRTIDHRTIDHNDH